MLLFALLIATADLDRLAGDAARIDRLIDQLGSEIFAEREAATKALDQLGEAALEPLKRAIEDSADAEVRRRAKRLVAAIEPAVIEARALAIRQSQMTPEEKGRRLKKLLEVGMTREEVYRLLGMPSKVLGMPSRVRDSSNTLFAFYFEYGLSVHYDRYTNVKSVVQLPPK